MPARLRVRLTRLVGNRVRRRRRDAGDERLDLVIGHLGEREDGENPADRHDLAFAGDPSAKRPADLCLDGGCRLVGLDLADLVSDGDLIALGDEPAVTVPCVMVRPHLGIVRLSMPLLNCVTARPTAARTASRSAPRPESRDLELGLNGTGVCGAVTIRRRDSGRRNAFPCHGATMSAASCRPGALVDHDQSPGVLDAVEDRVLVERVRWCGGR